MHIYECDHMRPVARDSHQVWRHIIEGGGLGASCHAAVHKIQVARETEHRMSSYQVEDKEKLKQVLLSYMEAESENRWCAGWLTDLHTALKGDEIYDWLVATSGGYWRWPETEEEIQRSKNEHGWMQAIWVEGKP